ncbi:hypothetical protein PPL_02295 [Heterostelium album PN500]|uniref:Uncharacterized protein n=1 Tax=Heterostelium pallidum (strain ATCC 26659 / Pp 5 / PN500) TaxID=670386 RepID=D3B1X0_HETP5|nr:hypothetical protein PPL_02295 [Heterostelium album PN500]EFA85294.1 hypothetical protein PPL_02295 [Heterostelium album PN500]|eukprot:XP_020437403.1 hypothetical protein PPL_02295 [Heterostelium album PN500]
MSKRLRVYKWNQLLVTPNMLVAYGYFDELSKYYRYIIQECLRNQSWYTYCKRIAMKPFNFFNVKQSRNNIMAGNRSIEISQLVYDQQIDLIKSINMSIYSDNMRILVYLLEELDIGIGVNIRLELIEYASKLGRLKIVKYLDGLLADFITDRIWS